MGEVVMQGMCENALSLVGLRYCTVETWGKRGS